MLTHWKNSNYGKCKFNDDTNLVLMGVNINNSRWCLLVADYIKKKVFIIDSLNKDNLDTIHNFMLV